MKNIFSFLSAFCISGIIIGAMYTLLPEGALKKPLKYVLCVCFVCCILASFPLSFDINLSPDMVSAADYTEYANEKAAELTVKSALKQAGIEYSSVEITPQRNSAGQIDFLYVTVYTNEPYEKVKNALFSEKIKVSVINE